MLKKVKIVGAPGSSDRSTPSYVLRKSNSASRRVCWTVTAAGLALLCAVEHVTAAPPVQTAAFYLTHPAERKVTLNRCKTLAAKADKDPDCVNARTAEVTIAVPKRPR